MMIEPLGKYVLIERLPREAKSPAGLVLPDVGDGPKNYGRIISWSWDVPESPIKRDNCKVMFKTDSALVCNADQHRSDRVLVPYDDIVAVVHGDQ